MTESNHTSLSRGADHNPPALCAAPLPKGGVCILKEEAVLPRCPNFANGATSSSR